MLSWNLDRWFAILSFLVATGLSYYFYDISREERDLVFRIDPNRSEIISASRVNIAPIKVLRRDGSPVQNDVYAIQFYLWNAGKRSIRSGDILTPLKIYLSSNASILDYGVLRMSRTIVAAKLTEGPKPPLRDLGVEFLILERNDGFVGQIIYEGAKDATIGISGLVEGVPEIRTTPVVHFWDIVLEHWLLYVLLVGQLFWSGRLLRKSWMRNAQGERNLKVISMVSAVFIGMLLLYIVAIIKDYKKNQLKLEADNSRQVPESLQATNVEPPQPVNLRVR